LSVEADADARTAANGHATAGALLVPGPEIKLV
jgi:hypothetical protein